MTETETAAVVDEIVEPEPTSLARQLADPRVPVTLDQLAARLDQGVAILDKRVTLVLTARKRGLSLCSPEDITLFKNIDGRITCYVSDAGCQRARTIWGINVRNVSETERIPSPDGQAFACRVRGDGECRLTGERIESFLGVRSSDEQFCKDKRGLALEVAVEKAARANLEGSICRALMGVKSVPLADLVDAWEGTSKHWEHCNKGRGFGTQDERLGATKAAVPDVPPPTCPYCDPVNGQPVALKYRPKSGDRAAFYGCPNWEKHKAKKAIVNADDWVALQQKQARELAADAREPGAEG